MINKYIKHARDVKISFDKLLKYLGLDNLDDLPDVISKDQKQANEIETYLIFSYYSPIKHHLL